MISVLENEPYNLKLCVDFRDLVPGGSYSTVTAELIENRSVYIKTNKAKYIFFKNMLSIPAHFLLKAMDTIGNYSK